MSTIAKYLPKPPDGFSTQISSSTVSATDLSVTLDSASGLPTEGVGQFFKKDANGNLVAGSVEFCHWTNVSGNTITFSDTNDRGITGSDSGAQSYVADDYFEVWVSSYYVGGYGGVVEHNADGTHNTTYVVTPTGTQTLTNKRVTKRVVTASDATSITPNTDNADVTYQACTQGAGTLTINADAGTPTNGQLWELWVKCTNAQTPSFNAVYIAMGTALPTTFAAGKNVKMLFQYDTVTSKWGLLASNTEA